MIDGSDSSIATQALSAANGVVLFPTDTLYGLGADAFSDEAVDTVYTIKGRNEDKPIHALVSDIIMAERYAEITDDVRALDKPRQDEFGGWLQGYERLYSYLLHVVPFSDVELRSRAVQVIAGRGAGIWPWPWPWPQPRPQP